ncbi:MAG: hypothetical protein ABIG93_00505 [archaeon]|nr:hypothetical protein [Nanoarchaeota archaeon]
MEKTQPTPAASGFDNVKLYTWVKALESKINNLNREFALVKNDLIKRNNDLKKDMKNLDKEVFDLRGQMEESTKKIDLVIKELKQTAGNEEVQVLKKYIEFWNPMNFVTQKDLDRFFEQKKQEMLMEIKESTNNKLANNHNGKKSK